MQFNVYYLNKIIKFRRRCLKIDRFDFLKNKFVYAALFILVGVLGYFAYNEINTLPKPGTISEFIKYYFQAPGTYAKAMLLTFGASFASISLGIITIVQGITNEALHIAIRVFLGIMGIVIIVGSFYFFKYFILLIISVLIIGAIAMILLSDSGRRR